MRRFKRLTDSRLLFTTLILLGTVAYRLPELRNPGVVNSDSAIVGLQAMHILRGEWHWFLWGSGYQTTADSAVAAALFLILGATPLALMATALVGHLVATLFAYLTLCRRATPAMSALLVAPLVISTAPTHTYTLHPPRQTALTLVFVSIWLLDGALAARRPKTLLALGAAVAALACYADPYALVFAPGLALLAMLLALQGLNSGAQAMQRLLALAAGTGMGAIPFVVGRLLPNSEQGPLSFSAAMFARNWGLLKGPCLGWTLGTRVYHQAAGTTVEWHAPFLFQLCQWSGLAVFVVALLLSVSAAWRRNIPWEVRSLGLMAALTAVMTVVGFLFSVMPMDRHASRYLVSLVLVLPFMLLIVGVFVRTRWLALMLCPLVASYAASGWLAYEPFVDGVRIVDAGWEHNEAQLLSELSRRGIRYGVADYWAAYRLTFMFQEQVIVVPLHESQDRYPAYRRAFSQVSRHAYIFDPRRSEESAATSRSQIAEGLEERFTVGPFEVYVVRRTGGST